MKKVNPPSLKDLNDAIRSKNKGQAIEIAKSLLANRQRRYPKTLLNYVTQYLKLNEITDKFHSTKEQVIIKLDNIFDHLPINSRCFLRNSIAGLQEILPSDRQPETQIKKITSSTNFLNSVTDIYYRSSHELIVQYSDTCDNMDRDYYQHSPEDCGVLRSLSIETDKKGTTDVLQVYNPMLPIYRVSTSGNLSKVDSASVLIFPSLVRGGLHHAELAESHPEKDLISAINAYHEALLSGSETNHHPRLKYLRIISGDEIDFIESPYIAYWLTFYGIKKTTSEEPLSAVGGDLNGDINQELIAEITKDMVPCLRLLFGSNIPFLSECRPTSNCVLLCNDPYDQRPGHVVSISTSNLESMQPIHSQLQQALPRVYMLKSGESLYLNSDKPTFCRQTTPHNDRRYPLVIPQKLDDLAGNSNRSSRTCKFSVIIHGNLSTENLQHCILSIMMQEFVKIEKIYLLIDKISLSSQQKHEIQKIVSSFTGNDQACLFVSTVMDALHDSAKRRVSTYSEENYMLFINSNVCMHNCLTLYNLIGYLEASGCKSSGCLIIKESITKNKQVYDLLSAGLYPDNFSSGFGSRITLRDLDLPFLPLGQPFNVVSNSPSLTVWRESCLHEANAMQQIAQARGIECIICMAIASLRENSRHVVYPDISAICIETQNPNPSYTLPTLLSKAMLEVMVTDSSSFTHIRELEW